MYIHVLARYSLHFRSLIAIFSLVVEPLNKMHPSSQMRVHTVSASQGFNISVKDDWILQSRNGCIMLRCGGANWAWRPGVREH